MIENNHNNPLSFYKEKIDLITEKGFKLIAVSQIFFEDTFVFETDVEAELAYNTFETDKDGNNMGLLAGWWYSREEFNKQVEEYEKQIEDTTVLVHWLD